MAMGMSYEQYWYGEASMTKAYREANDIRQKMQNQQAWLYGLYTYHALNTVIGNALKKKGEKAETYRNRPLPMTEEERKAEEMEHWKAIDAQMRQMAKEHNAKK